jgi:hypothetical protein
MAHKEQLQFVELVSGCLPEFFPGSRVIELGRWISMLRSRSSSPDAITRDSMSLLVPA